jgi:hypothetical protein
MAGMPHSLLQNAKAESLKATTFVAFPKVNQSTSNDPLEGSEVLGASDFDEEFFLEILSVIFRNDCIIFLLIML